MKAYFLGNSILSDKQHGIQATHAMAGMFMKYPWEVDGSDELFEWAADHKTIIMLNGGTSERLHNLRDFLNEENNPYPHSEFYESDGFADGLITSVCIILPEKIYEGARKMRETSSSYLAQNRLVLTLDGKKQEVLYTSWEVKLMERFNSFRLL